MKMCTECEDWKQQHGDGTQRICKKCYNGGNIDTTPALEYTATTTSADTVLPSSASSFGKKRKFLSSHAFDARAEDKSKRRIAPIKKWRELIVGDVYRVCKIHDMTVNIQGERRVSHYGAFQDSRELLTNVWLTAIINEELLKYKIVDGNVFIKPLGKKKSIKSGLDYHDFVIVTDDDVKAIDQ